MPAVRQGIAQTEREAPIDLSDSTQPNCHLDIQRQSNELSKALRDIALYSLAYAKVWDGTERTRASLTWPQVGVEISRPGLTLLGRVRHI